MFINFAKKLFEILVSDEYSYIKRADNTLDYNTGIVSLYKDKGSILYIVSIINAELINPEEYEELLEGFSRLFDSENRARLILMNVIVNDREELLIRDEDCLPGKKVYVFSYKVDLEKSVLTIPEDQPKLLGLDAKIGRALESVDEAYVNGTQLTNLENELATKTALPSKSENIYLTLFIVVFNIMLWALTEFAGGSKDTWTLVSFGAVSRNLVVNLNEFYRLFTAVFLHIGMAHLAHNCFSLYIFGSRVEKYFGKLIFLLIYFTSGVVGNIATVFFLSSLSAGASGAIFGLLGALLSVSYRTGRSISDLSPYVILLLCIFSIGFGFLSPYTNNYAHVAGFATGVVLGYVSYGRGRD